MSNDHDVIRQTRAWLEQAVIGLNLCPFAKAVHVRGQVHFAVSAATDRRAVTQDLRNELAQLVALPSRDRDTTLLILPDCLDDFLAFNDYLDEADRLVADMALDGVIQIASFHPQFQFAGTEEDDVTNCTNRSPYPMLHLLREESVARAVEAFPEADVIFEKNMQTLRELGSEGWAALGREFMR
ncbi:DUF1415 domain-containing protein [Variovorax sp. VNK109]|uniref:DUF1415 domain-containing protein n=1 Tax=Variovorax sp. VNK109 TaxID=3400919 RepID=UPI003C00C8CA